MAEVEEVLKAQLDLRGPLVSDSVREDATILAPSWSEEARRDIACFFRMLDDWDRQLQKTREAA